MDIDRSANDRRALESPNGLTATEVIRLPGGGSRQMLVSRFPIRDAHGQTPTCRRPCHRHHAGTGSFIEKAPYGVAMFDRDMTYVATSQRWAEDFGGRDGDFIGQNALELHPAMRERWEDMARQVLAGNHIKEDEASWVRADGVRNWYRWSAYPWIDHNGQPGGVIVTAENITAAKAAEAVRRENEQRYRIFFDNAAFGAAEIDLDGHLLKLNKRLCEMSGYAAEDYIGKKVIDLAHKDDVAGYFAARDAFLQDGAKPFSHEMRFNRKDGSVGWFRLTAALVHNDGGVPIYSCGIRRRRHLKRRGGGRAARERATLSHLLRQRRLRRRRTRPRRQCPEGEQAPLRNERRCRRGLRRKESDGRGAPRRPAGYLSARAAYLQGAAGSFAHEMRLYRKDGSLGWFRLTASLVRDGDGVPLSSCGIVEEVTARIEAEAALRESEQRHRVFFDNAAFGAAELDLSGRLLKVNKRLCEMGGYTADEYIGKKVTDLAPPGRRRGLSRRARRLSRREDQRVHSRNAPCSQGWKSRLVPAYGFSGSQRRRSPRLFQRNSSKR